MLAPDPYAMSALASGSRRALGSLATLACALAALILIALLLARPLGLQTLVDRSDSMQPAIAAGDLLLTRLGPPAAVRTGDVVTFADPGRGGRLITHRVTERRVQGDRWAFVTRGDANTASERWTVAGDGSVGRLVVRVPRAGFAVAWLTSPIPRLLLLGAGGLALAILLLRRIWA